jgi:hypothetical protein
MTRFAVGHLTGHRRDTKTGVGIGGNRRTSPTIVHEARHRGIGARP